MRIIWCQICTVPGRLRTLYGTLTLEFWNPAIPTGKHGERGKDQPDELFVIQNTLFMTQNSLFVNQMTQNNLFQSIYHDR